MPRQKVLITVTTYPLPSRSYDELVCTAGVLENGEWIRIYPVPLQFLQGLRSDGKVQTFKYNWIELDLKKRTDDFRPESRSPVNPGFKDMIVTGALKTERNWAERKKYCLQNVYEDMGALIEASKEPTNTSLATFKPTEILGLEIKDDDREWKKEWLDQLKQLQFTFNEQEKIEERKPINKLPYKFYYRFKDAKGKVSRMMIEDWEIGALYWKCLKWCEGDEKAALQKVREKYEDEFLIENDIYFFLGTTKSFHKRSKNPFVIIGVFYPKKETPSAQMKIF